MLEGRLAQFLSEGSSPNPRWLVKFDGQPHKDEEMYERLFGKLLSSVEEEDDQGDSGSLQSQRKQSKPSLPTRTVSSSKESEASSEKGETGDDFGEESKASANKISESVDGSNAGSDTSSNVESTRSGRSGRVSAREARSKRRQAMIDEDVKDGVVPADGNPRPPILPGNAKKRQREETDGGDVVKVKLLTGTLFLYRGRYRRVEFIRRV